MVRAVLDYVSSEAVPRWRSIVLTFDLFIAVVGGLLFYFFPQAFAELRLTEFSALVLTYAAIAAGFCLAGLTLALTLPSQDFAEHLANNQLNSSSAQSSYSDLIFIFSWTSVLHWALLVAAALLVVLLPNSLTISAVVKSSSLAHVLLAVFAMLAIYSVEHLLITILTLSQLGSVYIKHLKSNPTNDS